MFVHAINVAAAFTRPLHTIVRHYGSTVIEPGAATLFFVNSDGWALTCRHVAELTIVANTLIERNTPYWQAVSEFKGVPIPKSVRKKLEGQFGLKHGEVFELYNSFVNCVEGNLDAEVIGHPRLDIALVRFRNFKSLGATQFPTFAAQGQELKQGKTLCRLGFPFAEFTNYEYDPAQDRIRWTTSGRMATPRFPIEGMVTRHLGDENGTIVGFEMSTPGLRGQSGGPAFDTNGVVWGMQSATNHLDLNFDINQKVVRKGETRTAKDYAFLHVGHCVHVDALKTFMKDHGVAFVEA